MSNYEKQNFQSGQILTAAQLNHIEEGIEKILPAIEAAEQQLVTDANGELMWENKSHGYSFQEQILFPETAFTAVTQQLIDPPLLNVELGQHVSAIVNGVKFEGIIEQHNQTYLKLVLGQITIIGFTNNGVCFIQNNSGAEGIFSATTINKVYKTIDPNYLPISANKGTGLNSIILNGATEASGLNSIAMNSGIAVGAHSFAANGSTANGDRSFAINCATRANAIGSFAMGWDTIASSAYQCVMGKINIEDTEHKYALIVGNGTRNGGNIPSNAHTLDWSGNAWFAGAVEGTAMILSSPNGTRFQITVNDDGTLSTTQMEE